MRTAKLLTPAQLQALVTGIPVHCASTVFSVSGRTFTAPEAVTFITSFQSSQAAVATARAQWKDALQAQEASVAANGVVVKEIRDVVALQFSNSVTILNSFAIEPRKAPKPLTAEERAAATAKANATRKARGTSSKKQKATVSGNVIGVTITPMTAPGASASATATPATPAPATPVASTAPAANGAATSHG